MPLELVGGGEKVTATTQGHLEPLALAAAVCQQVHLQLVLLGEGLSALHLGTQVQQHALARAWPGGSQQPRGPLPAQGAAGRRRLPALPAGEVRRQLRGDSLQAAGREGSAAGVRPPGCGGGGVAR